MSPAARIHAPSPAPADVESLVRSHIGLVGHVVRETSARVPAHLDKDDLTSAGLMALFQAAEAYQPDRGVPFTSYARTRIRGAIVDEIRKIDWASRAVRRLERDVTTTRYALAAVLGREPNDQEVADALGRDVSAVASNGADVNRAKVASLEDTLDSDREVASSAPNPADVILDRERLTYLSAAIAELPGRHREIVEDHFLREVPMAETAARLGVTESRVSQMKSEAMKMMRDAMNAALDPHLLEAHSRPGGAAARRREAYHTAVAARQVATRLDRVA